MKTFKNLLLIVPFVFMACNKSKTEASNEGCEMQYKLTLRDNMRYNEYLQQNIEMNKNNSRNTISYHMINSEYIKYLDSLTQHINNGDLFFEGNEYSKAGKEFITRTNKCENNLKQLVANENIKHRLHYILNTNDPEQAAKDGDVALNNENPEPKLNAIYFRHLDYYFKGLSKIHIETLLSNKKRNLLELENEFLTSQTTN